jgi:hypothetical protein
MVVALTALAGCSGAKSVPQNVTVAEPAPASAAPSPDPSARDGYVGHFVGVEGMFLDVEAMPEPHHYKLTMQWDLDHRGTFYAEQKPLELALDFVREGEWLGLMPTTGDRTGLKYLAGKKDCLMVKKGEAYCRD